MEDIEAKNELLDRLELAQEEDRIRQEVIEKENKKNSFRDNLNRAENHRNRVKLMEKHKVWDYRIAEKIERCSFRNKNFNS